MKRTLTLMAASVLTSVSAAIYAGTPISPAELPAEVQKFISTHFPGDNIRKAEKDNGRRGMEYEVDLSGGAEIDFRDNGDWKEVKAARGNVVPAAIVPAAIAKYVSANFDGRGIVEISRKRGGYEIELSDGTELKLTEDAKPMQPRQRGNHGARH